MFKEKSDQHQRDQLQNSLCWVHVECLIIDVCAERLTQQAWVPQTLHIPRKGLVLDWPLTWLLGDKL